MIWSFISLYGVSPLLFMDGYQGSTKYCECLRARMLPFAAEVFRDGHNWCFQEVNTPFHTSNFSNNWR